MNIRLDDEYDSSGIFLLSTIFPQDYGGQTAQRTKSIHCVTFAVKCINKLHANSENYPLHRKGGKGGP